MNVYRVLVGRGRGFTLIELMIVLVILGVLLAIGSPSLSRFVAEQRLKDASFEFQSSLMVARNSAMNRGMAATVTVQPKMSNWSNGWTVVAGGATLADAGPFFGVAASNLPATTTVIYRGDGRIEKYVAFSFSVPADSGISARCVRVDPAGMPYSKTIAEGGTCN